MKACKALGAAAALALALATALTACSSADIDAGANSSTAQPGVLRTLATWAGSPDPGGRGYHDGTGSQARFDEPLGVAATNDGSLWITEPRAGRVRRIDAQGQVTTALDIKLLPPVTDAAGQPISFGSPLAIVAGPSGEIFVAVQRSAASPDAATAAAERWAVLRIAPGQPPTVAVLPAPGTGVGPMVSALALDAQGRLVIGDFGCAIWRSEGSVLATTPPTTEPRGVVMLHGSDPDKPGRSCNVGSIRYSVTRLTLDAEDRVLFALRAGEVQRIEHDGRITWLGYVPSPTAACGGGMALDRAGRLLLTDGSSALLQLEGSSARVVAGSMEERGWFDGPASSARFNAPCGIAIDPEGRVVVSDQYSTVRRIANDGSVTTVAGLAPQAGHRDGTGTEALFSSSFTIGPGVGSEVVVADAGSRVVRRVDARQRVSTLAGVPSDRPRFDSSDGPVATARLSFPRQALASADGSLWIVDQLRLRLLGPDGIIRTLETEPDRDGAVAMALDRAGDVVVARGHVTNDKPTPRVHTHFERYSTAKPHAAPVRLEAVAPGDLLKRLGDNVVRGLCVLPDGTFAYTQGHAVLRRSADGTVALLAGSPDEVGKADGAAGTARFQWPAGVACDAAGGIYVADSDNHTVRYIDAQRNVRTVLGTPGRAGHRVDTLPGELHAPSSLALVPGGLVVATGQGLVRAGF